MYARILVAIDDTETSKLAFEEAIKLAKDQNAKLCIVYVADEYIEAGEGVFIDFKKHEAAIRKKAKAILTKMKSHARKEKVKVEGRLIEIVEFNDLISEKILEESEKWQADLIVLGTHGRSGISRVLLGSVAEEVVRKASRPVHIVKG